MIATYERAGVEAGKQIFGVFQKSDSRQRLSVGFGVLELHSTNHEIYQKRNVYQATEQNDWSLLVRPVYREREREQSLIAHWIYEKLLLKSAFLVVANLHKPRELNKLSGDSAPHCEPCCGIVCVWQSALLFCQMHRLTFRNQ